MKIGILTFHFGINYGGVLQCYALQTFLEEQGHDVEIINFIPPGFSYLSWWRGNGYRQSLLHGLRKAYCRFRHADRQRKKFESFRKKYLKISKPYTVDSMSGITDDYSAIIVGSDQVWNPSQHYHAAYFLHPFVNFRGKRISYAPCCARNFVDNDNFQLLRESLLRFDSLSIRNMETRDFVNNIIEINPEIVVDPTLLTDADNNIDSEISLKNDYILAYVLGNEINGGHSAVISEIKNRYGNLPVYAIILSENKPQFFSWSDKSYWDIGPAQWVTLIKNASFIYTDSFHGLLFALKHKKPFLAYYSERDRASRFIDLSARYNLGTFIVNSYAEAIEKGSFNKPPDYTEIESLLSVEVKRSISFLKNALTK